MVISMRTERSSKGNVWTSLSFQISNHLHTVPIAKFPYFDPNTETLYSDESDISHTGCICLAQGKLENLINLSSPRLAKTVPFVILLCLMADDFTRQWSICPSLFLNPFPPRGSPLTSKIVWY